MSPLGRAGNDVLDASINLLAAAGFFLVGFAFAFIGLAIYAAISFAIAYAVAKAEYEKYLAEEAERFDNIIASVGADGTTEDVLHTVFGVDDYSDMGYSTTTDWVVGSLFGVDLGE